MILHTVTPGQTVFALADLYDVSPQSILSANALPDPNRLAVGQDLVIPKAGGAHTVAAGESLYTIGRQHGLTVEQLLRQNPNLTPPYTIYPGQILFLPPTPKLGTVAVNGYAYPTVSEQVLRQTLPYLTYLSVFSYKVQPNGTLGNLNDEPLLSAAKAADVAPVMVITNTNENGGFDSDLVHTLLTDEGVSATLRQEVLRVLAQKGYYGVDVDFEYIPPADREAYARFLEQLRQDLQAGGYSLSTALAPKIRADQTGTLYEAHDYALLGEIADAVILMTYEWGYLYGPPMAVAPLNEVRRVLNYAVTAIDPQKILMGMPNYAYDWTLPYTPGRAAEYLSVNGAVNRAIRQGAAIQYSDSAAAPFYTYTQNGANHIVWFENARSTRARLRLVQEFGLKGVSYWTVNNFFPQNWAVLTDMYDIAKVL